MKGQFPKKHLWVTNHKIITNILKHIVKETQKMTKKYSNKYIHICKIIRQMNRRMAKCFIIKALFFMSHWVPNGIHILTRNTQILQKYIYPTFLLMSFDELIKKL